jgi:uncharacterized protein
MSTVPVSGWNCVDLAAVAPQPWRNGAGLTRELAAWPGAQDWAWRISVAEVSASGPFSDWPGVSRWFAVLAGAGLSLQVGGTSHLLDADSAPLAFDGASPCSCELRDGPTQDLNLMLRQGRAEARMLRVKGTHSLQSTRPVTVAVYAAMGSARLEMGSEDLPLLARHLAWRMLDAPAQVHLMAEHALWMEIET